MPLIDPTISGATAWNSWSDRPAEMVFLPLGVTVTPVLYATSTRRATTIAAGPDLTFGTHDIDGTHIGFSTHHAGTTIDFAYRKVGPWRYRATWHGAHLAEWGLRYWVTVCLSGPGMQARYCPQDHAAVVKVGSRWVALVAAPAPVQTTVHDSIAAVVEDFEQNGYFYRGSRGDTGPVVALRFNLEMMRHGGFGVAVADSEQLAIAGARAALAQPADDDTPPLQQGLFAGALDAIRDVMGWNTLYDRINHRPYTAVSRIWNLGDFAVWYNDQTYAALMTGLFDPDCGRANMAVAMASATPQGNFACIVTSNDAWVDRTQAPNGAFMAWMMYLRTRDRSLLERVYAPLARNNRWWRAHRDPDGRGLVSCGTSDVGEALYKGTHFGARNETGMDNSPTHDEAIFDPATGTLSLLDVGLNCCLALDAEMLALMARELGHQAEAEEFSTLAETGRALIRTELWDEARGLFANRQRTGGFVRSVGPTSFYPLICGAADDAQAAALLVHLDDPDTFGGPYVIPNVSRDDPAFADNVYWRGRIWPNVNFFIWHGLRRYGMRDVARAFAEKSMALFNQSWVARRQCGENYNARTGEITDQPDTDPFLSWGAMLPLIGVSEVMDVNPWAGWEFACGGPDRTLGPVQSPLGLIRLVVSNGRTILTQGEYPRLRTTMQGVMSHVVFSQTGFACDIAPAGPSETTVCLPGVTVAQTLVVRFDGYAVDTLADTEDGLMVTLPAAKAGRLQIAFSA
ncbi:hypothetical protein AA12717_1592 [Gluconacetobacter sacchari DSM 12717]|uniref:Glycoside hydrolase family 37 n=2 Tax=Gluconacetobacter sacchari TaxID=92759 RepID=A0A7W4NSC4_9PROT|nr:trehalase family glycosidase [Gluconacetobacter sacchari]MBB2161953.1 glycoside hydrolase family 37 [Gluconacetobacter sacchari]GBQ23782.1 hypothetical protein AA12717_1592 [Gluconacetobacter sacchari DSM 12717]